MYIERLIIVFNDEYVLFNRTNTKIESRYYYRTIFLCKFKLYNFSFMIINWKDGLFIFH